MSVRTSPSLVHAAAVSSPLLNTKQAAEYLKQSPRTLERWRVTGRGPRFFSRGGSVRYRLADLDAWIEGGLVSSTSEVTP